MEGWIGPRTGPHASEEKNSFPLLGIEPKSLGCPARSLVIITTALARLHLSLKRTENIFERTMSATVVPFLQFLGRMNRLAGKGFIKKIRRTFKDQHQSNCCT
jgi:hypothetical protein